MNEKNNRLSGVGSNLQLGKSGPRLKANGTDTIEVRNSADSALTNLKVLTPAANDDLITKTYAETTEFSPNNLIVSNTTGTDTQTLPQGVASLIGTTYAAIKLSPQNITNLFRLAPFSGDKITFNNSIIESSGYIEIKFPNYPLYLTLSEANVWSVTSGYKVTEGFSLVGRDTWVSKTSATNVRTEGSGFSLNGYSYLSTGLDSGGTNVGTHDQYNDSTNAWTNKTSDTARYDAYGTTLNGFGYIMCGFTNPSTYQAATNQYNDSANTWTSKTVNPTARYSPIATTLNGYSYVTGGISSGGAQSLHNQYNDNLNAWTSKTAYPNTIGIASGSMLNGFIYLTHGIFGSTNQTANYQYSDIANTWLTKSPSPLALYGAASYSINGKGYTSCGITTVNLSNTYEYNDLINLWTSKTSSGITARRYAVGTALSGYGYATSGITTVNTGTHDQYN